LSDLVSKILDEKASEKCEECLTKKVRGFCPNCQKHLTIIKKRNTMSVLRMPRRPVFVRRFSPTK